MRSIAPLRGTLEQAICGILEGMCYRVALLLPVVAALLPAQSGTKPKAAATDYPVHAQLDQLAIGAEYTVHSFSGDRTMFFLPEYLVVEVALFPAKGEHPMVNADQFALRINGKRQMLAQAPEFVAPSLQGGDWRQQRPPDPGEEHESAAQAAVRVALPGGEVSGPVSGFLYFPYHGKVRSLDLVYQGPGGSTRLKLR